MSHSVIIWGEPGEKTDSSDFAVITFPEGNSKEGWEWDGSLESSGNPTIPDGSDILVTKEPPEPPKTARGCG